MLVNAIATVINIMRKKQNTQDEIYNNARDGKTRNPREKNRHKRHYSVIIKYKIKH